MCSLAYLHLFCIIAVFKKSSLVIIMHQSDLLRVCRPHSSVALAPIVFFQYLKLEVSVVKYCFFKVVYIHFMLKVVIEVGILMEVLLFNNVLLVT